MLYHLRQGGLWHRSSSWTPLPSSLQRRPQWCSHHSWLVLQLAPTHTMPYLGKDKVRNKLKRICSRPLKMLPMEAWLFWAFCSFPPLDFFFSILAGKYQAPKHTSDSWFGKLIWHGNPSFPFTSSFPSLTQRISMLLNKRGLRTHHEATGCYLPHARQV